MSWILLSLCRPSLMWLVWISEEGFPRGTKCFIPFSVVSALSQAFSEFSPTFMSFWSSCSAKRLESMFFLFPRNLALCNSNSHYLMRKVIESKHRTSSFEWWLEAIVLFNPWSSGGTLILDNFILWILNIFGYCLRCIFKKKGLAQTGHQGRKICLCWAGKFQSFNPYSIPHEDVIIYLT